MYTSPLAIQVETLTSSQQISPLLAPLDECAALLSLSGSAAPLPTGEQLRDFQPMRGDEGGQAADNACIHGCNTVRRQGSTDDSAIANVEKDREPARGGQGIFFFFFFQIGIRDNPQPRRGSPASSAIIIILAISPALVYALLQEFFLKMASRKTVIAHQIGDPGRQNALISPGEDQPGKGNVPTRSLLK
jgi:hypothetical protein